MRILAAIALTLFLASTALAGGYQDYGTVTAKSAGTAGSYYPAAVAVAVQPPAVQVQVAPPVVATVPVQPAYVATVAATPVTLYREARPGEIRRAKRRQRTLLAVPAAPMGVVLGASAGVYSSGVE